MSRFYASIQGCRGEATRQGTPQSGIRGHIRGWDIGAYVTMEVNDKGEDVVHIEVSRGSNGYGGEKKLGSYVIHDGEITRIDKD